MGDYSVKQIADLIFGVIGAMWVGTKIGQFIAWLFVKKVKEVIGQ